MGGAEKKAGKRSAMYELEEATLRETLVVVYCARSGSRLSQITYNEETRRACAASGSRRKGFELDVGTSRCRGCACGPLFGL